MSSDATIQSIDGVFGSVLEALDLKEQRKAMRGAMRREANRIRKMAVGNMTSSGLLSSKGKKHRKDSTTTAGKLGKGIYARVYPDKYGAGFMVSVTPHGKRGIHKNRQGLQKPVLMWAEEGTRFRRVGKRKKGFTYTSKRTGKKQRAYIRGGHSTGTMPTYGFMEKTEAQATMSVEQNLFKDFQDNLNKAIVKKGLQ